jgi:hypothetical protein
LNRFDSELQNMCAPVGLMFLKMGLVYLEGIKRLLSILNRVFRVSFYIYFNWSDLWQNSSSIEECSWRRVLMIYDSLSNLCIFYVLLLLCSCILILCLCMATLTEVFLCFFLSCKANNKVKPAKTGTARTLPNFSVVLCIVCFVSFCVLFVCMFTVLLPPGGYPIAVNKYILYIIYII